MQGDSTREEDKLTLVLPILGLYAEVFACTLYIDELKSKRDLEEEEKHDSVAHLVVDHVVGDAIGAAHVVADATRTCGRKVLQSAVAVEHVAERAVVNVERAVVNVERAVVERAVAVEHAAERAVGHVEHGIERAAGRFHTSSGRLHSGVPSLSTSRMSVVSDVPSSSPPPDQPSSAPSFTIKDRAARWTKATPASVRGSIFNRRRNSIDEVAREQARRAAHSETQVDLWAKVIKTARSDFVNQFKGAGVVAMIVSARRDRTRCARCLEARLDDVSGSPCAERGTRRHLPQRDHHRPRNESHGTKELL
jgi:hypothetical protein